MSGCLYPTIEVLNSETPAKFRERVLSLTFIDDEARKPMQYSKEELRQSLGEVWYGQFNTRSVQCLLLLSELLGHVISMSEIVSFKKSHLYRINGVGSSTVGHIIAVAKRFEKDSKLTGGDNCSVGNDLHNTPDSDGYVRRRFTVYLTHAIGPVLIEATHWEIQDGCLVFRLLGTAPTKWVAAFGAGAWSSVHDAA